MKQTHFLCQRDLWHETRRLRHLSRGKLNIGQVVKYRITCCCRRHLYRVAPERVVPVKSEQEALLAKRGLQNRSSAAKILKEQRNDDSSTCMGGTNGFTETKIIARQI